MRLNNIDFFNYSKNNCELTLDENYIFVEQHPELKKYQENLQKIKNILITIKTLKNNNESTEILDKYYQNLADNLNKYSNVSEFICFVNACDNSLDSVKKEIDDLKIITEKYFEKRILNDLIPAEWIQALIDNNSSRRKGKNGENKLIKILNDSGFKEFDNFEDFNNNNFSVIKFSSKINLNFIRKKFNILISTKTQNKNMDLVIKFHDQIFFCEAKHINTNGGGQDKQLSELIEITNLKEKNKNIHFIAFLDGKYSNILLNEKYQSPKILTQRNQIIDNLKNNPNNFWVNSFGFKKLFESFGGVIR
jgi:hypothetical protein